MAEQQSIEITLERIVLMKAEKLKEIEGGKERIADIAQTLFAPDKQAATKTESITRMIDKGVAVFDGFMLGLKVVKTIRTMFCKRKNSKIAK
jgi:hypothetical protein